MWDPRRLAVPNITSMLVTSDEFHIRVLVVCWIMSRSTWLDWLVSTNLCCTSYEKKNIYIHHWIPGYRSFVKSRMTPQSTNAKIREIYNLCAFLHRDAGMERICCCLMCTYTFAKNFSNSCNKLDESLRQKVLQGTPNISVIRGISTLYRIDEPHHY